jgi:DNA-binding MarR family transcriptional regulator
MLSTLALEVNSLSIHLVRYARRADAELGVPPARLSALSVLAFGGDRTITALAEAEQVAVPTISRVVDGLVDAGLARRRPNPDDARSTVISATAKGTRLMHKGRDLRIARLTRVLDAVPERDRAAVERAVRALRNGLTEVLAAE